MRERKSVRGANRDSGAGHGKSGRTFGKTRALQTGNAGGGNDQMNAAKMNEAFDARRRLARISGMDRRGFVVVPRVRALRLSGAAPGHGAPGDRAQRERRGYYRADKTSDPVFH